MDTRQSGADESLASAPTSDPAWRQAVDNRLLLVLTLFFVTAALGLPLLWISRGFSAFWKVTLTIAVLAWTALIFWLFWLVMVWTVPTIWQGLSDISRG